jgi:pyroglutamyl-peptidase
MGGAPRILITGFRPFPGAPYNPTEKLVERLLRLRRPAFENIERIGHVFPVTYAAIDRELPELIVRHRPDALLMFGLATRTPFIRIETRARNAVTQIWPDAAHTAVRSRMIVPGTASTRRFGPHTQRLLRAARATGIDARASLNAGAYLCNYLSWRAIEATRIPGGSRLAAFIHVPLVPRDAWSCRYGMTLENLVETGEALLVETARLVRSRTDHRIVTAHR